MSERRRLLLGLGALGLLVLGLLAAVAAVFYVALEPPARAQARDLLGGSVILLVVLLALYLTALLLLFRWAFARYVTAGRRLADQAELMLTVNRGIRVEPAGSSELRRLAALVNRFGDRTQELQADVDGMITDARADLEEEKNRLAALMSELTMSVLVCNIEGRILLYNPRAKHLLTEADDGQPGSLVGLGRSLFTILERGVVVHALENLHHQFHSGDGGLVSQFVTTTKGGQLIRAHMAPVLDVNQDITGFVLTLEDVTRDVERDQGRDLLLQSLLEHTRSALGTIRAAIESLSDYPDMDPRRRLRFIGIIGDEAVGLTGRLDTAMGELAQCSTGQWPLEEMRATDLVSSVRRRVETALDLRLQVAEVDPGLWLRVDSFSVALAVTYLAARLKEELGVERLGVRLSRGERMAQLDLHWSGAPLLQAETMRAWETDPMNGGEACLLSLQEVAERHGGQVWYHGDRLSRDAYFRLLLPVTDPGRTLRVRMGQESRPEYYDFDLFNQPGQTAELDERLLTELTYTVFDTETTGLEPSRGDRIVSLGAVRIVNGRLLHSDAFDQLVDPGRPVPALATAIHGITAAMLRGRPAMEAVLPRFHLFAEDTVLVAHNAAFDMRFLQAEEAGTGVIFINPVLDTLLLSAVLHPDEDCHELEAIAERLGINLIGRHTSLGDAIVTGEALLKMIPLLAEKGIYTLAQARAASQETYYARLEY